MVAYNNPLKGAFLAAGLAAAAVGGAASTGAKAATTIETFAPVAVTVFPNIVTTKDGLYTIFSQDPLMETPPTGSNPQVVQTTVQNDSIGFELTNFGTFNLKSITALSEGAPQAVEIVGYQVGTGIFTIPAFIGSSDTTLNVGLNDVADASIFALGGDTVGIDSIAINTSAVPEPSGWALGITGVGLAGAALRRRRSLDMKPSGVGA